MAKYLLSYDEKFYPGLVMNDGRIENWVKQIVEDTLVERGV